MHDILSEKILPSVSKHGIARVLLAGASLSPAALPRGMKILRKRRHGHSVKQRGEAPKGVLGRWPREKLVALQFPYLCFILEGEADLAFGDAVVSCPAGYGVVIPPGVPLSDGREPHWQRAAPELAHSDI